MRKTKLIYDSSRGEGSQNLSGRIASQPTTNHYFASFCVCERSATAKTGHTLSSPIFSSLSVCSFGGVYHQVVHINYHVCELIVYEQVPSPLFNFKKRKKMLAFLGTSLKNGLLFRNFKSDIRMSLNLKSKLPLKQD